MTVEKSFKYLWLKTVVDVDLMSHCAKCLIGEYNDNISNTTEPIEDLKLDNEIHYLCGVSEPYNWNNNFHLAFMPSKGDVITLEDKGISIAIVNAKIIPISESYIDYDHKKAKFKSYHTCRNWQFAHWFNQYHKQS